MNANDPIRMSDLRKPRTAATTVTRFEAERQFKLSFALVMILTVATLATMATMPMSGWNKGYGVTAQVASQVASTSATIR